MVEIKWGGKNGVREGWTKADPPHTQKKNHCLGRKESLLNETKKRKRKGKQKERRDRTEKWACLDSSRQTIVE